LYSSKLVKISRPEFIVLYNGKQEMPDQMTMRLSDAFKGDSDQISLELEVTVYNINQGRNPQMMNRSRSLADYAAVVAKIREYQAMGQSRDEAIANTVLFCVEHGIMKDFMEKYGSEVYNMLNAEITLEDVLAIRYEEGHEDGMEKGMEKGARRLAELIQKGYSVDDALKLISSEKETRNQ
jgi:hypothetical protein